jgi:putative MFS transporter
MTPASSAVAARLDRLPVGRYHRRFLVLVSLGAWFDYYDNFVAGSLAVILPAAGVVRAAEPGEWLSPLGLFMAALPAGMFLGTIFLGLASDYLGRRFGFIAMLLLYSLATLAGGAGYYPLTAVAGASAGFALLLATRLLAGAGIGAENVIIDAYVSEMMPREMRGWAVSLTHAFAFTAFPVAALLARLLAPQEAPQGWWLLLTVGSLGALLTWYFRRQLPESPRWLAAVGRHKQAETVLVGIEAAVERDAGKPLPSVPALDHAAPGRGAFQAIWSRRYRGRTLLLVAFHLLQTVGYYGFMHWLPSLFVAKGFDENDALQMQFAAALLAPVGPLLGVWSSERWQRRGQITALAVALAAVQLTFGAVEGPAALVLAAGVVVVGSNWFSAVFHAYQAELFPTAARATGIGFTYAWSRASLAVVSLFMPGLIAESAAAATAVTAAAFVGVAVLIGLFGPRTNARALEEIAG